MEERSTEENNGSLLCGDWGVLLFLFYYEHFYDPSKDNAAAVLQALYERLDDGEAGYNFCNGLSGAFWMMQHLNEHGLAELDMEELASGFISVAIEESKEYLLAKNFDYLHGSAGIVNFLIPFASTPEVRTHLELFVANLAAISKATKEGISLPVFNHVDEPGAQAIESLSMAHGSCALQVILARIHEAGIAKDECSRLIYGSVDFVMNQRIGRREDVALFTQSLYPNTLDGTSNWSRVSWCYGDLSVALALWHCGQYFKESKWTAEALDILRHNTYRTSAQNSGISDSCFCHGAAGAAVIYRKFWHETGIQAFYDFSEHWYQYLLNDTSIAEHRSQKGIKVAAGGSWLYSCDLLNGSAGVGLALLSRLHDKPLAWYDCFLITSG